MERRSARSRPGSQKLSAEEPIVPRDLTAELETYLVSCAGEPAGADARYDPLHESIRNRVAALDAPTGGEVDWDSIVNDARTMLGASKDLVIASFLAFGLY